MKKSLMMTVAVMMIAVGANADVLYSDDFSYPDGSLVGNGPWTGHSGTAGDFLVANGQAVVTHGAPSEDVNVPVSSPGGDIYFAFDFSVDNLGAPYAIGNADYEYFAHFKDDGTNYAARMDIVPPSGGGDFSVGISSDQSTAEATWPTDLTYDTVYRVVVRYNQDDNIAQLWIDPTTPGDLSITGADALDPGDTVTQFALRQSDSVENETVRVDNLVVATECADSFEDCAVAVESQSWGAVKSLYR